MIKPLKILGLLMIFWSPVSAQSQWAGQVSKELGTFQQNYLYPSVLRALNVENSVEFNNLIKDIRYLRILRIDSAFIAEHQSLLTDSEERLEKESFENIAQMVEPGSHTKTLFVKVKNEQIVDFLAFIKNKDSVLIVEIVGELNVKNLRSLMDIDYNHFNEFVGLDLDPKS